MEIKNDNLLPPTPVSPRIQTHLPEKSAPYHMKVGGMNVELRYKSEGQSLQQKMIQLCQQIM